MTLFNAYWSEPELYANGLIILNIFGAAVLGMAMGYERSYHGHSAGMRTYGLVCMASAALTVIGGYSADWFGGSEMQHGAMQVVPTQVIQGIVTGIGFLGAGVIMKDGFSIRGLSTAASIWVTAAIGVIIGVGFYATAVVCTLLVLVVMGSFKRLELRLPHHRQMRLSLTYHGDDVRPASELPIMTKQFGYAVLEMSAANDQGENQFVYDLVLAGDGSHNFEELVDHLRQLDKLVRFHVSPVRD